MKKAKYSEKDTKGRLFVDCSECDRGGNGSDKDKCSSGWKVKKGHNGGCFMGVLMCDYRQPEPHNVSASGSNELLCVGLGKLVRIATAAEIIAQDYWKYINEDTAKEELKNAIYDYKGWREKVGT